MGSFIELPEIGLIDYLARRVTSQRLYGSTNPWAFLHVYFVIKFSIKTDAGKLKPSEHRASIFRSLKHTGIS